MRLSRSAIDAGYSLDRTFDTITTSKDLESLLERARLMQMEYLTSSDPRDLEQLQITLSAFNTNLRRLGELTDQTFDELKFEDGRLFDQDALKQQLGQIGVEGTKRLSEYRLKLDSINRTDRIFTIVGPLLVALLTVYLGLRAIRRIEQYQAQQMRDQAELRDAHDRFASVIKSSHLGIWEWNLETNEVTINDVWAELIGYTMEELEPITVETYNSKIHPDDYQRTLPLLKEHLEGKTTFFACDTRMKHKDGHWVWILNRGQVTKRNKDGKPISMTGTHADISECIAYAEALRRSEEENQQIFESMNQGFAYCQILVDEQGVPNDWIFLKVNKNFEVQTGMVNAETVGKRVREILSIVEPYWFEYNGHVALTGEPKTFEAYNEGLGKLFRISSFSPATGYFAMIIDDITQQRETEEQLIYEKNLFETTLLSVGDGVISTNKKGYVHFMNKAAEKLTGWDAEEARGRRFEEVFRILSGKTRTPASSPVQQVLTLKRSVSLTDETILIARDGFERYISEIASPILDANHMITGVVLVFRDSTEQHKKQNEILSLSFTDALTTLHNRRYYDRIKKELDSEPYYPLTLLIADVNGLKLTNDAFGHDIGDDLLRKVSDVFRRTCREGDIISRIGGDEFVLLLPQTDARNAQVIVKRLNAALEKEQIKGIQVSVSIGYAVKENEELSFEEAFKMAEDVMYQNKLMTSTNFKKQVISSLLKQLFKRDHTLEEHSRKVAELASRFADIQGYRKYEVQEMYLAGIHHDLGKIAVDPNLMLKPENELTKGEELEIQRHSEIGYNILRSVGEYAPFSQAVLYHHERWDGHGFPQGLKHEAIPESAQILAIANTWADLTGPRLYDDIVSPEEAIEILNKRKGTMFSPELVETFITQVLAKP